MKVLIAGASGALGTPLEITKFGVVLLVLLHVVFSNCSAWKSVIYGREQVKKYDTELSVPRH